MGMTSDVVAIGPFDESLRGVLSLPSHLYEGLADGTILIEVLFSEHGLCGSSASRQLAAVLGVDPWDLNTHHLDPAGLDARALGALVGDREAQRFVALRRAGFRFYFRPNM